ncbi:unnamed protein product [Clonostachys rhizophaga]|uniref:Uncharacterized protein n=1 Tax=Clonostachys rhizophaga TaxID=160324 RepID=A0A9N9YJS4_9HYPO|nr:unnamed protein product [Clonostachys rhizophaga]
MDKFRKSRAAVAIVSLLLTAQVLAIVTVGSSKTKTKTRPRQKCRSTHDNIAYLTGSSWGILSAGTFGMSTFLGAIYSVDNWMGAGAADGVNDCIITGAIGVVDGSGREQESSTVWTVGRV